MGFNRNIGMKKICFWRWWCLLLDINSSCQSVSWENKSVDSISDILSTYQFVVIYSQKYHIGNHQNRQKALNTGFLIISNILCVCNIIKIKWPKYFSLNINILILWVHSKYWSSNSYPYSKTYNEKIEQH